jgi:DNA-directed RNA polymerase subunit RPC12/RpoP
MKRKNFYNSGNDSFVCEECHNHVNALSGGFRNHCSYCLWCKHVDIVPGDRAETCQGMMETIRKEWHSKKGWMIVHKCVECGKEHRNKTADDDNFELLLTL